MISSVVTVGTTATVLATGSSVGAIAGEVHLQNTSGVDIYIGGSSVTVANGIKMVSSDSVWGPIQLKVGTDLYGIVAAATAPVRVMEADL